ncbi:MAG TPA: AraC family transcriptional regulator, partial [Gammaproteobacteria bacterium]|nr:AraC family transcriptional regulator [Gammaproteobacteria bacterium]
MNYKERINRAVDFIGEHLDDELTLEQLSSVACFSKYHFHRLFTAYMGLSLKQYIKWLRLKRAAHQLIVERDKTIIEIALDAGFESHESFTRIFKQICG